jgi:uncharacterized protein YqeY
MQNDLQNKIKDLLKEAMKAGDEVAKLTYRGLLSSFMTFLVANGRKPQDNLSNEEVLAIIKKEIKKREDSIKQFVDAGRKELAESEILEKEILAKFLPAQLSMEEVEKKVKEIVGKLGELDVKQMGKYIGMCVKELKDVADGNVVKSAVEKFLGSK